MEPIGPEGKIALCFSCGVWQSKLCLLRDEAELGEGRAGEGDSGLRARCPW